MGIPIPSVFNERFFEDVSRISLKRHSTIFLPQIL